MNTFFAPLVSVIVPVYNVAGYLDVCLTSIRQQTYTNLQILVIEDCSTDDSLMVLKPHLIDKRIKLIQHERNGGLSMARNTGIENVDADANYIMFVDSDDLIDEKLVEACVFSASNTDADLIIYDLTPFEDGKSVYENNISKFEYSKSLNNIGDEYFKLQHFAWLKFIRASILRSNNIRFPVGLYYEDWPFHWKLGVAARNKFLLNAKLYYYRQRATSITGSTGRKLLDLFKVQTLVLDFINTQENKALKKVLGNKLLDSHWGILTRIDPELLSVALNEAKSIEKTMRSNGLNSSYSWRRQLIKSIIRMPQIISAKALTALRSLLSIYR